MDTETYVLCCYRYIGLNPVRARMTDDPARHPWSSAPSHCGLRDAPWLHEVDAAAIYAGASYDALMDEDHPDLLSYKRSAFVKLSYGRQP